MNLNSSNSIESKCKELVFDIVKNAGLILWDVRFEKEGAYRYLRFFIDKEGGVSFDDCEAVHDDINSIVDAQDFVDKIDILEIGSPGLERALKRTEHLEQSVGKKVKIKLYKAIDGTKEFKGILNSFDGEKISVKTENDEKIFEISTISKINLDDLEE